MPRNSKLGASANLKIALKQLGPLASTGTTTRFLVLLLVIGWGLGTEVPVKFENFDSECSGASKTRTLPA
eukprot:1018323-Rhodomonas_salina.1